MAAVSGKDMTLSVDGDVLAQARSVSIAFSQDTMDGTNADSDNWKDYLSSLRGWTVDAEALWIATDVAKKVLQTHYITRIPPTVEVIVTLPGPVTYTGDAILTSFSYAGTYNDVVTFSVSLQGTGALVPSVS